VARCAALVAASIVVVAGCSGTSHGTSGSTPTSARSSAPSSTAPSDTIGPPPSAAGTTSSPTTPTPASGAVTQRYETPLPMAIQEAAAASTGAALYVVGGYDTQRNSRSTVFVYDGTAWANGPALPIPLNHPGAAAIGGDVYVAGGFTPAGATNRAFELAAGSHAWRELPPLRRARGALALVAFDGKLYAIGGRDGSVQIATPEIYDPAVGTWSDLTAMPAPRNHVAGYIDGARVCVAGGRTPASSAAVDCYDPQRAAWQRPVTLPTATSGAAAVLMNGVTLVAGGEPAGETSIVGVVQTLRNGAWTTTPMLVPRHGTASAIYRGRLWACGGAIAAGFDAVDTCTSFSA
jgi:N-acetylneuraminic acid mutarotase